MSATRKLAEFIYDLSYDDISETAIKKAKLCILDLTGVMVGGYVYGSEDMNLMVEALSPFFGQPQAALLTKKRKVDLINAALINGTASHLLDYDDIQGSMSGHPSPPVIPAALAMGEYYEINGRKLIEAVVSGIEAECRIGRAVNPEHYAAGWHATATLGHFGACAAAAKIMNLDIDKIVSSFGIAGTQAGGLRQSFGTMCKPFHAGRAASNGILAAVLAGNGFTAPQEILDGVDGFAMAASTKFDETRFVNFGQPFEVESVIYKRYSSCYETHGAIRCMLDIRNKYDPAFNNVDNITVTVSEFSFRSAGIPEPRTPLEGKFSIRYCAALALMKGQVTEEFFTNELVNAPETRNLMSKINVVTDKSLRGTGDAEIHIVMTDGSELNEKTSLMRLEYGVTPDEWEPVLAAKANDLLVTAFSPETSSNIIDAIKKLEDIDKIKNIVELMS